MAKPKVGFFDFTGCEGCQIELTNYGDADFLDTPSPRLLQWHVF